MDNTPNVFSMTGFARVSHALADCVLVLEGRSVNAKGLDIKVRVPSGFDVVEKALREGGVKALGRGNVSATLSLEQETQGGALALNVELASKLWNEAHALATKLGAPPPSLDAIMRLKGIIETIDSAIEISAQDLANAADELAGSFLEALIQSRAAEGARLADILSAQISEISGLSVAAREQAEIANHTIRERLKAQVDALLEDGAPINPERFEQEVALLVVKADIREEVDRLDAHVAEAMDLLCSEGPKGRRLDFLTQEFNREANTLCSKASTMELKRIGLDLKTVVDQMREQVQNVE